MPNVTIPKELVDKKDLVAVPRSVYEEFLDWLKKVKSGKTFKPTLAEKESLRKARKNLAQGEFLTLEELRRELGIKSR